MHLLLHGLKHSHSLTHRAAHTLTRRPLPSRGKWPSHCTGQEHWRCCHLRKRIKALFKLKPGIYASSLLKTVGLPHCIGALFTVYTKHTSKFIIFLSSGSQGPEGNRRGTNP